MIVCRDVEASDGVSIRTLVESCIRVKRFPQADVGLNPKENAVAELWIQSSAFFRGNVEMCLLVKAAREWERLSKTEYHIVTGRRGKSFHIRLKFAFEDFPHLSGMQYARDVDFGIRSSEYYGEKLIPALLNGRMDGRRIENGRNWERIRGRLDAIIGLKETLEGDFLIAQFNAQKVRGNSRIDADFIIKNERSGETYFVFIDEKDEYQHYCKSAFAKENVDYMENQSMLTVLKKEKIENGETVVLYRHPNFREE